MFLLSQRCSTAGSAIQAAKVKVNSVPSKGDYIELVNMMTDFVDPLFSVSPGTLPEHTTNFRHLYSPNIRYYATIHFALESLHGANAGLLLARNLMEKVKREFPWISYGDLWTLTGVAAIQEMAGPHIPWRPGRIDGFSHQATPDGRLPDGADHLRHIFYRMGFNDQETVALSGAHALGRCHTDRSGFDPCDELGQAPVQREMGLEEVRWLEDKKTRSLMMLP